MHTRGNITRHHLIPGERVRNKTYDDDHTELHFEAILKLWKEKHYHWHALFHNLTLDEIIVVLERIKRIKVKKYPRMKKQKHKRAA
jgi:hypothetical protein